MATDNETLRDQMRQTEKDTIDVVTFLKKQDLDKDTEVNYSDNKLNLFFTEIVGAFATRSENSSSRTS